jgi:hypothetical protein
MAPRVRARLTQRVSYREDSSDGVEDEEEEEESFNESEHEEPAPRRRQIKRKRSPLSEQISSRVRRQPRKTYAEESSGDDSSAFSTDDPLEFDDEATEVLRPTRSKKARTTKKSTNSPRKAVQTRERTARALPTRYKSKS